MRILGLPSFLQDVCSLDLFFDKACALRLSFGPMLAKRELRKLAFIFS